MFSLIYISNDK